MMPAFSPAIEGGRRAEELGVVEGDRGDDGHLGLDHVRRVPLAADADLDDGDVNRSVGKDRVGEAP